MAAAGAGSASASAGDETDECGGTFDGAVHYFYSSLEAGTEAIFLAPCGACGGGDEGNDGNEDDVVAGEGGGGTSRAPGGLPGAIQLLAASSDEDEGDEDAAQNDDGGGEGDDGSVRTEYENRISEPPQRETEPEAKTSPNAPEDSPPEQRRRAESRARLRQLGAQHRESPADAVAERNPVRTAEEEAPSEGWCCHGDASIFESFSEDDDVFPLDERAAAEFRRRRERSFLAIAHGELNQEGESLTTLRGRLEAERRRLSAAAPTEEEGDEAKALDRTLRRVALLNARVETRRAELELRKLELEGMKVKEELSRRNGSGSVVLPELSYTSTDDDDSRVSEVSMVSRSSFALSAAYVARKLGIDL